MKELSCFLNAENVNVAGSFLHFHLMKISLKPIKYLFGNLFLLKVIYFIQKVNEDIDKVVESNLLLSRIEIYFQI